MKKSLPTKRQDVRGQYGRVEYWPTRKQNKNVFAYRVEGDKGIGYVNKATLLKRLQDETDYVNMMPKDKLMSDLHVTLQHVIMNFKRGTTVKRIKDVFYIEYQDLCVSVELGDATKVDRSKVYVSNLNIWKSGKVTKLVKEAFVNQLNYLKHMDEVLG